MNALAIVGLVIALFGAWNLRPARKVDHWIERVYFVALIVVGIAIVVLYAH